MQYINVALVSIRVIVYIVSGVRFHAARAHGGTFLHSLGFAVPASAPGPRSELGARGDRRAIRCARSDSPPPLAPPAGPVLNRAVRIYLRGVGGGRRRQNFHPGGGRETKPQPWQRPFRRV